MATYTKPSAIKKRRKWQRVTSLRFLGGATHYIRTPKGKLSLLAIIVVLLVAIGVGMTVNDRRNEKRQQQQVQEEKRQRYGELTQAARAQLVTDYLAEKKYTEAYDAVAFASEPESKENLLLLALIHESQQQYDKSVETLLKVKEKFGLNSNLAIEIAGKLAAKGDKAAALDYYEQAIDLLRKEKVPDAEQAIGDIRRVMEGLNG